MRKRLLGLFIALGVGLLLGLWLVAYLFQDRLVWFPGPPPDSSPADYALSFEELELTAADGVRLHGWLVEPLGPDPARGAVLFSHGNAGNLGGARLAFAHAFARAGWASLLYDYRGYGKSAGSPSEEGTYLDAEAAYDRLKAAGFEPARIVAYGESLGAAVSLELALRRPLGGVVLESAFTSIPDIGAHHYPLLPVRLLARIRYDNLAKIGKLGVPLLVIHSPADTIVPIAHGRALLEAAPEPKAFLEIDGDHNDGGSLRRPEYQERVAQFLALVAGREKGGDQ